MTSGQVPVSRAYNASYSGGRDQEDQVWSQPRQIVPQDPILEIPNTRAGGVAQDVGPEFKPQYHKKNDFWPAVLSVHTEGIVKSFSP
jgi:hypothetical protein